MADLRELIRKESLAALRAGYSRSQMTQAMVVAIESRYPPLSAWNREIEALFYGDDGPVAPIDRERCLIALLAQSGPPMSLAVHLYWGLMEGLEPEEIGHTLTLVACYSGVPRLAEALPVYDGLARVLESSALTGTVSSTGVLANIMDHFMRRTG